MKCIVVIADRKRLIETKKSTLSQLGEAIRVTTYDMTVSSIFSVYTADLAWGFDALRVLALDENGRYVTPE